MQILFVCTGNTCRSSMAEGLLKHEAKLNNLKIDVISAGTHAAHECKASAFAIDAMSEMGIDINCHRSKPVTLESIENSDIILTMTKEHKYILTLLYPSHADKIFTLMEYIGEMGDVLDPFGGNIETYRGCMAQLRLAIQKLILKIQES